MRKFYAATNQYGTPYNLGFANTWRVMVFANKKSRDSFVDMASDVSTIAIKKSEIQKYIPAPKPFSGKCRQLWRDNPLEIEGLLGEIIVDWSDGGVGIIEAI